MPILTVLHTNDLHARFEQMTRLGTLIRRERAQAAAEGRAVLLLDAGDSSSANAWESDVTGGRANYALLEAMGHDAAVLGNSDTQWGTEALRKLLAAAHFKILAANLREAATGAAPPNLHTHALFRFEAFTAAVIGLTTHEETEPVYAFADPAETLRNLLPQVQAEGAHIIILLSHLGFEVDQKLAAETPGLHLILGGHTHTALPEPVQVGETAIGQTGEFGNALGRIDLAYDDSTQAVTLLGGRLLPCTPQTPPDPTLAGMLELIQFEAGVLKKKKAATE